MRRLGKLFAAAVLLLGLCGHVWGQVFLVPGLDRGRTIHPNSIAGGPVLWLQARPEYFGTTGARSFDGEQYIQCDQDINPGTSDFWFSAWIKVAASTVWESIFSTGGGASGTEGIWVSLATDGKLKAGISDGSTQIIDDVSDAALDDNTWHHVAINLDRDGNAQAYVDGVDQTANSNISALNGNSITPSNKPRIGKYASADLYPFHGDLSKIAYGTGLLTPTEIAELYNSGNGITRAMYSAGLAAKTVHSWNCNEAPEATLYDSTGSNDGTPSLPGTELVTNGDMELDSAWDSYGTPTTCEQSSEQAHGGTYSWKVVADGSGDGVKSTTFPVVSGNRYRVSAWIYNTGIISIKPRNIVGYFPLTVLDADPFTQNTWSLADGYVAATGTGDEGVRFEVGAANTFYLDNISVVRTGPHVGSTAGPEATNYLTPGDGDTIVSWTCRATDVDFIQATAASRPVYVAPGSAIGAKYGALDFDGTDDYLSRTVAGWMSTSTSGAIFLVMEVNDTAAIQYALATADTSGTDNYVGVGLEAAGKLFFAEDDSGTTTTVTGDTALSDTSTHVLAITCDGSGKILLVDGDEETEVYDPSDNGHWLENVGDRDNVSLGAIVQSAVSGYTEGMIAEIIQYDGDVTTSQRDRLIRYLKTEYAISP
jgi:hypothetical protein